MSLALLEMHLAHGNFRKNRDSYARARVYTSGFRNFRDFAKVRKSAPCAREVSQQCTLRTGSFAKIATPTLALAFTPVVFATFAVSRELSIGQHAYRVKSGGQAPAVFF